MILDERVEWSEHQPAEFSVAIEVILGIREKGAVIKHANPAK